MYHTKKNHSMYIFRLAKLVAHGIDSSLICWIRGLFHGRQTFVFVVKKLESSSGDNIRGSTGVSTRTFTVSDLC